MASHIKNMTQGKPVSLIFSFALPLMIGNVFPQVIVPARAEFLCHQDTEALGEALDDTKHHPVEPVRRAKGGKGADT